jgi:hypothetical protein
MTHARPLGQQAQRTINESHESFDAITHLVQWLQTQRQQASRIELVIAIHHAIRSCSGVTDSVDASHAQLAHQAMHRPDRPVYPTASNDSLQGLTCHVFITATSQEQ